jgi:hypothetical protein
MSEVDDSIALQQCYEYERLRNKKLIETNANLVKGLKEIRNNLRSIDGPNEADEYIDEALDITIKLLKECGIHE